MRARKSLSPILTMILGVVSGCQSSGPTEPEVAATSNALEDGRAAVDGYFDPPTIFMMKPGNKDTSIWRYTFTAPAANWMESSFVDTGWNTGEAGFGDGAVVGDHIGTPWTTSDIWARRTFTLTSAQIPVVALWGRWDDYIDVFINGRLAASTRPEQGNPHSGWTDRYRYLSLSDYARAGLLPSPAVNTIAVHVNDVGGGRYLDLGLATNPMANPPVSGTEAPGLSPITKIIRDYMAEQVIPGGVVAILKEDKLVMAHGFGYADKALTRTVPSDAIMRLASVDKALTFTAARQLIEQGFVDPVTGQTITADTHVFPLLAAHGLTLLPGAQLPVGMNDITIQHIIDHTSGLGDFPQRPTDLYAATGTTADTYAIKDGVRYLYSQPLIATPGAGGYSSNAPMVLRYLISLLKGNFETYLQKYLVGPAGSQDVFIAHERIAERLPREIWYATLAEPSDRWIGLDDYYALQTSGEALARYARRWDTEHTQGNSFINPVTGLWTVPANTDTRSWGGVMPGSWAYVRNVVADQVTIAVMFNIGGYFDPLIDDIAYAAHNLAPGAWGIVGPSPARQPVPNDVVKNVAVNGTLSWVAGTGATSHQVWFGSSHPLTLRATQTGTTWNPGVLQPNTTYYWRIDEKNSAGIRTGTVWSFTTGASGSSDPCAGLCASPITFTSTSFQSGNLGTAATCHQTTASLTAGNCGNFASGRTFKINNVTQTCTMSYASFTLPSKRNGGYCFQASAGGEAWASFTTW